jgi:DNA-binding transcriptional regulator/RsmH inhibitor MraZ
MGHNVHYDLPPMGIGDAHCDKNWRIRIPVKFAIHFLEGNESARLYLATLDGKDILLWRELEFLRWMNELSKSTESNEEHGNIVLAMQVYGGESEIDRQGRFILPKSVRENLEFKQPTIEFKIISGPIRLTTSRKIGEDKQKLVPLGEELYVKTKRAYARYRASVPAAGESHG